MGDVILNMQDKITRTRGNKKGAMDSSADLSGDVMHGL